MKIIYTGPIVVHVYCYHVVKYAPVFIYFKLIRPLFRPNPCLVIYGISEQLFPIHINLLNETNKSRRMNKI